MGTFDQLEELRLALVAAGVRDTSLDPSDVKVPGIWIKAPTVSKELLDGYVLRLELVLIVSKATAARALEELGTLLDIVAAIIDPAGDIRSAGRFRSSHGLSSCAL
jgi:hypothetical protein